MDPATLSGRLRLLLEAVHRRGEEPDGAGVVAARVEVDPEVVEAWLAGTGRLMSGEQAARVAAEYGVPVSFLLDEGDQAAVGEQLRMLIALRDRR